MLSKSKSNDSGGKKHGLMSRLFHHSDDDKKKPPPENDTTQRTVLATVKTPPSKPETPNKLEVSKLKPKTLSESEASLKTTSSTDLITTTSTQQS